MKGMLLALIWASAIGLAIYLVYDIPPKDQGNLDYQVRIISPIAGAFLLTIFVLVSPWGLKSGIYVLLGMLWVCTLPLVLVQVKKNYESFVLSPICSSYEKSTPAKTASSAFLSMSNQPWFMDTYHPIECKFEDNKVVVKLNELAGKWTELLLNMFSGLTILALSLLVWGGVTAIPFIVLYKRFSRNAEPLSLRA